MLKVVKDTHGKYPDSAGIQEVGNFGVVLAPRFGIPFATDNHVRIMQGGTNKARGVATYCDEATSERFQPLDTRTEIVTTIHDIVFDKIKGKKKHRVGIMKVYALNRRDLDRSPRNEIRDYVAT